MKALIVIEIPEIDFESCRANVEIDVGKKKIFRSRRIIRPMPKKREEEFITTFGTKGKDAIAEGWNACLEEILGETKWNH